MMIFLMMITTMMMMMIIIIVIIVVVIIIIIIIIIITFSLCPWAVELCKVAPGACWKLFHAGVGRSDFQCYRGQRAPQAELPHSHGLVEA